MDERDDRLPLLRRGVFDRDLEQEVPGASGASPLALVMVDLDKFKVVNDTHGHPVGDELLLAVAQLTEAAVARKGRAYRFGGEEFALLLPNSTTQEAVAHAGRVRSSIAAGTWTSRALKSTASFGVALAPSHGSTPETLLKAADLALYEAKDLGRNCVRVAGEPRPTKPEPREVKRRIPTPGGLTEKQIEELRLAYFRAHRVLCPTDRAAMKVQETTGFGYTSPGLHMWCRACGLEIDVPGIPVNRP